METNTLFKDGGSKVWWNAGGYLCINVRQRAMVISGGRTYSPAEIEAQFIKVPETLDCAVFGTPHPKFGWMLDASRGQCKILSSDLSHARYLSNFTDNGAQAIASGLRDVTL